MADTFVPRQAKSRAEISKMTDEELMGALSAQAQKDVHSMTRTSFTKKGEGILPGESEGARRVRVRRNRALDSQEFALAFRLNLEVAYYNSKGQKQRRLADQMSASITKESVEKREADEKAQVEKDQAEERESGMVLRPEGYGPFVTE